MMLKRTACSQIELTESGIIQVRLEKRVIDDDGRVLSREPHRMTIEPGHSLDEVVRIVNDHLVNGLKFPPIDELDATRVAKYVEIEHTPEIVEAFDAFRQKRDAFNEVHERAVAASKGKDEQASKRAIDDLARTSADADSAFQELTKRVRGARKAA